MAAENKQYNSDKLIMERQQQQQHSRLMTPLSWDIEGSDDVFISEPPFLNQSDSRVAVYFLDNKEESSWQSYFWKLVGYIWNYDRSNSSVTSTDIAGIGIIDF